MEYKKIDKVLAFLNDKEGKEQPIRWKLLNGEPLYDLELEINDNLDFVDKPIKKLPNGLKVDGYLDLMNAPIKELPNDLNVANYLNLEGTRISKLPSSLYVGTTLFLNFTDVEELPKGLKVGGNLFIEGTFLTSYTDEELQKMVKPNGYIKKKIIRE